jgi:hypothetical protein
MPLVALVALMPVSRVAADNTLELWGNLMAEWQVTPRWLLTFDAEPKMLLVGAGQWETVDLTTTPEFAVTRWLDLMAELVTGYTVDSQHPNTTEVTERLGLRLYLIRSRFQLRDTFRFEQRNRFYSDATSDHLFRTRNRVEMRYVLNRERTSQPGAVIVIADFEYFIVVDHEAQERYASRYRIRAGIGYRLDPAWRVDLLYMYQRSRNTYDVPFSTSENIIDLRFPARVLNRRKNECRADAE